MVTTTTTTTKTATATTPMATTEQSKADTVSSSSSTKASAKASAGETQTAAKAPGTKSQQQQKRQQQPARTERTARRHEEREEGLSGRMTAAAVRVRKDDSNSTRSSHSRDSERGDSVSPQPANCPWILGSTDHTATAQRQQSVLSVAPTHSANPSPVLGGPASPPPTPPLTTAAARLSQNDCQSVESQSTVKSTQQHVLQKQQSSSSLSQAPPERLTHPPQQSVAVESVLSASCSTLGFDIAEIWLRTGPKTHQLTNSYLRSTALEDTVRNELIDVYYGDKSSDRTHRLSPALCKKAKEANDVVWVTSHTQVGAEALRISINNVRTAVAIPVCHDASNTNLTVIYFSIRRIIVKPQAIEFLVHMSLAAAVASVNALSEPQPLRQPSEQLQSPSSTQHRRKSVRKAANRNSNSPVPTGSAPSPATVTSSTTVGNSRPTDLQWKDLRNVEYLTDGGTSWIHTAILNNRPVVVKTLKPECQDVVLAINEIESELTIHSKLSHTNITEFIAAGVTSKGVRFLVLERLDGGTLSQRLGYESRIRDRRRRFWRKKSMPYLDVLTHARSLAAALAYCQETALEDSIVMHRDLKPDNIGFTLSGTMKLLDFGLAKVLKNATVDSNDVYQMSGETGSLRYMAPEVAGLKPYNHKADVYSFGMILWEMNAGKKPFDGLDRDGFYKRVVESEERPAFGKKWPDGLCSLIRACWQTDVAKRPTFGEVVQRLDLLVKEEKSGGGVQKRKPMRRISGIIDRHSTWF